MAFAPRHPREKTLLDAIGQSPHDDTLRQVYGDWLEENGYAAEAELLSLEREIRGGRSTTPATTPLISDREMGRLGYRLRTIAVSVPTAWRVLVARPPIERCGDEWAKTCPKAWDGLTPTENPFVRSCRACEKSVHFAPSIEAARRHVSKGERVVVDLTVERRERDLDVAPHQQQQQPPVPPPPDVPLGERTAVTELLFFRAAELPGHVGALVERLHLPAPEGIGRYGGTGSVRLPVDDDDANVPDGERPPPRPPLSQYVHSLNISYWWDMHHERPAECFADIANYPLRSFGITFSKGVAAIDAWLRTRYGAPREVIQRVYDDERVPGLAYRVYGKCLLFVFGNDAAELSWNDEVPEWALPPTDQAAALTWLSELVQMLPGASYEELKTFAGRPPAHSGIVVRGPLNKDDFWLRFEPKLPALDVARVLGIQSPAGTSGDVHMSSWSILSVLPDKKGVSRDIMFGEWRIDPGLDGFPSGEWVEGHFATKYLLEKDRIETLVIKRS